MVVSVSRKVKVVLALSVCFVFGWSNPLYSQTNHIKQLIKVPKPRSEIDLSYDYHIRLLKRALERGSNGRVIPEFSSQFEMEEGRASLELMKGQLLDVFWMGTDFNKEQQLRAIRIPTTRGLIGFRKFIIRKQDSDAFSGLTSLTDLKQFSVCQGTSWPDTIILKSQGFNVATTPTVDNLYKMLAAQRCDFFPRGFHDYQQELALRADQYPNLISYQGILLHYPFAVYFFTNKQNEVLANWIEQGLEIMVENGEMMDLLLSHPLTRDSLPIPPQYGVTYLKLDNPILPADTDYTNRKYWFTPTDFGFND